MAEREGFEPSLEVAPQTRLAGERLQPARPSLRNGLPGNNYLLNIMLIRSPHIIESFHKRTSDLHAIRQRPAKVFDCSKHPPPLPLLQLHKTPCIFLACHGLTSLPVHFAGYFRVWHTLHILLPKFIFIYLETSEDCIYNRD